MIGIRGIAKKPITDATATANDIVSGKIAYINSGRVVGTHTCSGGGDGPTQTKEFFIPARSSIRDNNNGLDAWSKPYSQKRGGVAGSATVICIYPKSYFTCNSIQSIDISSGNISLKNITDRMSGEKDYEHDEPIGATCIQLTDDVNSPHDDMGFNVCRIAINKTTLYVETSVDYRYGVTIKVYYK